MENPFNITKANDYSDIDIASYWVDFFGDSKRIKPNSPMPILIKGSKGSGKTHLLKYFSYELQKIKSGNNLDNILNHDKYIGIFYRCSGLNSDRFKGKGISDEDWTLIFSYYLELWFAQKLISILIDFQIESDIQKIVVDDIILLFDKYDNLNADNLEGLLKILISLQKKLDYEIKNIGFNRNEKPKFELLLNTGTLIYGIPKIITKCIPQFKDIFFLYIIDEFENITLDQQKIFNSLYRERDFPGSFRIGGRLYAFKTFETLGSNEENIKDSEYEIVILDEDRRENEEKYSEFIIEICTKKLENNSFGIFTSEQFVNYFEKFDEKTFLLELNEKGDKSKDTHVKKLINNLKLLKLTQDEINTIISNISFEDNKLIEKAKYLNFYRDWKKGKNLLTSSSEIKIAAENYVNNISIKSNTIAKIIEYYKFDLLDQLARESSSQIESYVDIYKYIKMSAGSPRNFLNIIKISYDNEYQKSHLIPFTNDNLITIESQLGAIKKVTEWFLDTNRIPFRIDGEFYSTDLVNKIGNFLREIRFSNTPPECSINLFSIDSSFINKYSIAFNYLLNYSYLIKSGDRRGNNDDKKEMTFYINGTIAPYYELSINKRGVIKIGNEILNSFLLKDDSIVTKKLKNYNAPFREIPNLIDFTDNE